MVEVHCGQPLGSLAQAPLISLTFVREAEIKYMPKNSPYLLAQVKRVYPEVSMKFWPLDVGTSPLIIDQVIINLCSNDVQHGWFNVVSIANKILYSNRHLSHLPLNS